MPRERATRKDFPDRYVRALADPALPPTADALFPAPAPLEVDLGCGRGRFLLARARRFPGTHFIGVDRMRLRLRKLDARLVDDGLTNVRLIYGEAAETCSRCLAPSSVSAFYVLFSDPWPKRRHHVRRLLSASFVDLMVDRLTEGGAIHVATDHAEYFRAAEQRLAAHARCRRIPAWEPTEEEHTDFEVLFRKQGLPIYRCSFRKAPVTTPAAG